MPRDHDIDRLRLIRTDGVGPVTYRRLLERYASPAAALDALPHLARSGGKASPPKIPSKSDARWEIEKTERLGGHLIFLGDPDYPPLLAQMEDAPPVFAVLGDVDLLSKPAIGVVGGRNASTTGLKCAEMLAQDLAVHLTVISGLARGIDGIAHTAAMRTGRTAAAIACGLDVVYPPENAPLQRLIAERGAVITEFPPGTEPHARHFPRRNRLIAGLSLGVLVIEAARQSGSLITARIAQDLGREVFAVPGSPLDPRARGGNDLIREGAVLTAAARDVLDNLPGYGGLFSTLPAAGPLGVAEEPEPAPAPLDACGLDRARSQVAGQLGPTPTKVDDLARRCHLSASAVLAVLLELELAGRAEALPGNRFALLTDAGSLIT